MTNRNSEANKRRWAKVSPKKRTEQMKEIALFRWIKTSKKARRKHAMKMVKARKLKVRSESKENIIKIKNL